MPEKIALLLGEIAHEGVTSGLAATGHEYKQKKLNASVENWQSILEIFRDSDVQLVLGKITGEVYSRIVSQEYEAVRIELFKAIAKRPNRFFAYEDLLASKTPDGDTDGFWHPSAATMVAANRILEDSGLEILPYKRRAEVTVSAQQFVEEVTQGLLFRLYVPSGRMWGDQIGQLLTLFRDYLQKIAGLEVRLDQTSTSKGLIFAFHGAAVHGTSQPLLAKHFEEFTRFTDLCMVDAPAAEAILKASIAETREAANIVARYAKESRRLQLDLKHNREEKILSIRHRMESELFDALPAVEQDLIAQLVESLIPNPAAARRLEQLPLLANNVSTQAFTINIRPQIIQQMQGIVAQEISGTANLNQQDNELIQLFRQHAPDHAGDLTAALQELNDESAPKPERITAGQRLKKFLIVVSAKIGDVAAGVLQSYVEKRLGL